MSRMLAITLLGLCTGFRAMTPIALVCWFAYTGYLPVQGTWAFWIANPITLAVFTLLAIGEYIGDKLPKTPARTAFFPLLSRLAFGGLTGALVVTSLKGSIAEGVLLGVLGAALGSFGGYHARHYLVHTGAWPDMRVALIEDGLTLALSFLALRTLTG